MSCDTEKRGVSIYPSPLWFSEDDVCRCFGGVGEHGTAADMIVARGIGARLSIALVVARDGWNATCDDVPGM